MTVGNSIPRWPSGKESAGQCRRHKRPRFDPWVGKIPWRKAWQPTPVFLPGESHGQRSLEGATVYRVTESDMTEAIYYTSGKQDKNVGKTDIKQINVNYSFR